MEIICIAAMAANRVIGKNNTIPWHLPGEQARFRQTTWGHCLIMGRKTYESIGHPLPGRRNIIVTRNRYFSSPGCDIVHSLEEGLSLCAEGKKVFIIGGEELYRLSLAYADTLILTVLHKAIEGDVFFPLFSDTEFILIRSEQPENVVDYRINTYRRTTPRPAIPT